MLLWCAACSSEHTSLTRPAHSSPFCCRQLSEHASFLSDEGKMLQEIQQKLLANDDDDAVLDAYVEDLATILDRKEEMVGLLQDKIMAFRENRKQLQNQSLPLSSSVATDEGDDEAGDVPPLASLVSTSVSADTPP